MVVPHALLLFLAAFLAGTLNSVAGGGSFISFPTLMFTGVPPINANATNTIALWPGTLASAAAYRSELRGQRRRLLIMGGPSLVGGLLGALLLLRTPEPVFLRLVPYLLLLATLLFAFGGQITGNLRQRLGRVGGPSWLPEAAAALLQLVIATYGGFFGGGIGIMMLATLALMGMDDVHEMNGVKTVLASLINGVAVVTFIIAGAIYWPQAALMIVGAVLGGYGGARTARRLDPLMVRRFVIAVGIVMTVYFFVK
jgi:uncharacterized protein